MPGSSVYASESGYIPYYFEDDDRSVSSYDEASGPRLSGRHRSHSEWLDPTADAGISLATDVTWDEACAMSPYDGGSLDHLLDKYGRMRGSKPPRMRSKGRVRAM